MKNHRQSVTLSSESYAILISDLFKFKYPKRNGKINLSGFLNDIYQNYYEEFTPDPIIKIKEIIQNIVKLGVLNAEAKSILIKMIDNKIHFNTHSNTINESKTIKLLLNNENYDIVEEKYKQFDKVSIYLKNLFESYALLPKKNRELIFYKKSVNKINTALLNQNIVLIKTIDEKEILFEPYFLTWNENKNQHYLLGYEKLQSSKKVWRDNISLNIVRKILIRFDEVFDKKTIYNVDNSNLKTVYKVKLDSQGLKQFFNQFRNRPDYNKQSEDELQNNIFTFQTTEDTILLYFLKFGSNAKIIEPKETADLFKQIFKNAYENYNQQE